MTRDYAIILDAQRFTCFYRQHDDWLNEPLKGEAFLECATSQQLTQACTELADRLAYASVGQLFILYHSDVQVWLPDVITTFSRQPFSIMPLQPWLTRARAMAPGNADSALYERHLLPLLCRQLNSVESAVKTLQREEASDDRLLLARQLEQEQKENLALLAELEASRQAHNEAATAWKQERAQLEGHLSSVSDLDQAAIAQFMPLFFAHFWQKVSPADMAMLLGSLTLPDVRSPWPEPDKSALAIKRRDFNQLRHRHQQQIKSLARKFIDVGYLSVRPDAEHLLD